MWLYGNPIYQTIFSLVYFSDINSINKIKNDDNIFRIYLDSTFQMIYLSYTSITNCFSIRDEDISVIPIQNIDVLKRPLVADELKSVENNLKSKLKSLSTDDDERKFVTKLLNRVKSRRALIMLLTEQFDFNNKSRYENLILHVNSLKELIIEVKTTDKQGLDLTKEYFCDKLCRIFPSLSGLKSFKYFDYDEAVAKYEKFLNNLNSISKIYEINEYCHLIKSIEEFNKDQPSFLLKSILELNMFPNKSSLLFGKTDLRNILINNMKEFKINFLDENSDLITNLIEINKEIIFKNIKNRSRQLRDSKVLFDNLAYMVMEGNQIEQTIRKNQNTSKKTCLTNYLLRQTLGEMIKFIWISFELELFSYFELDYVFWMIQTISDYLSTHIMIISNQFADKILKEEDFVKSNSKKKLTPAQKMVMDEIHIIKGLKFAVRGLTLMCRYLKMSKLINVPESGEAEAIRITNRFPFFKNSKIFIDLSYENFTSDISFDPERDRETIFQSADSYFKQSVKILNELKGTDLKLRDSLNYSNEFIENLSKAIISNNLVLSKIKKLGSKPDKKIMLNINTKKYATFLPILEIN